MVSAEYRLNLWVSCWIFLIASNRSFSSRMKRILGCFEPTRLNIFIPLIIGFFEGLWCSFFSAFTSPCSRSKSTVRFLALNGAEIWERWCWFSLRLWLRWRCNLSSSFSSSSRNSCSVVAVRFRVWDLCFSACDLTTWLDPSSRAKFRILETIKPRIIMPPT